MIESLLVGWLSMLVLVGAAQAAGETVAAIASAPPVSAAASGAGSGVVAGVVAGAVSAPAAAAADKPDPGMAGLDACEKTLRPSELNTPSVKIASRFRFLPLNRPAEFLLFSTWDKNLGYRVLLEMEDRCIAVAGASAEAASYDAASKTGTDFRHGELPEPKTLLRFVPSHDDWPFWQPARVTVVVSNAGVPLLHGRFDTRVTSPTFCFVVTLLLCALVYVGAAVSTFYVHKSERADKSGGAPASAIGQPRRGTRYHLLKSHLNPVVLTAGGDGHGSATKMQVMFFSLLVFGLATHILLISGHLSNLSSTVLLLLGISGLGATAATGAEVAKTRLDFDNWAWLIARKWLPEGGVGEVNRAEWQDIVTTAGEFDVQRFQMIAFSLLVGSAMLVAGADANDLGAFDIPKEMLGLLGLSQVVYISGKLTAPPTMKELNDQIGKLIEAERKLRVGLTLPAPGTAPGTPAALPDDEAALIARVGDDYKNFRDLWHNTRLMFNSCLGRNLQDMEVIEFPFPMYRRDEAPAAHLGASRHGHVFRREPRGSA